MVKSAGGVQVDGSRIQLGRTTADETSTPVTTSENDSAPAVPAVDQVAHSAHLEAAARAAAKAGVGISLDFAASPLGADAAAQLFLSELQRGDPRDIVGLTQYVSALGVQVGYEGTPLSHFNGLSHRMARVPMPEEPPAALLPVYMKVQELSARTKQIAIALQKDQSASKLRAHKSEAVFMAHTLAEIWRRAPDVVGGAELQQAALQALKNVAELQGRVQFAMQDFVEETKRGLGLPTEGAQPLLDPADGQLIFRNSLRLGRVELDPGIRAQELGARYQKALKKGVQAADIEEMSAAFLQKAPHGARFEYVLVPKQPGSTDKLRVTLNEAAGHSMLAGIDPANVGSVPDDQITLEDNFARVAGGARVLCAADGNRIVLVDPKSGHYRAPTQQADELVPFLTAAQVPRENIIVTSGDPLDTMEVLAIDIWTYKAAHGGNMPKEVGDDLFKGTTDLQRQAVEESRKTADALFGVQGGK